MCIDSTGTTPLAQPRPRRGIFPLPFTRHLQWQGPAGQGPRLHGNCGGWGVVRLAHAVQRRGEAMPTYIMLSTLTDDGRETIQERPERITEVNREVEAMGARVVQQWAVLGPYDFVN